jgi:predicted TIM-barrel fold metal-dependent hydrolase
MLIPENSSSAAYASFEGSEPCFKSLTVDERIDWMGRVGIDFALVNPGAIGIMASLFMEDQREDAFRRCNDFVADYVGGHTDRLAPVTLVDWRDLPRAVAELERMRAKGSRAFWIRAEPCGGMSPAHPAWDTVWSAATDLGMLAILHVGNTPAWFEGWANAGWNQPGGTGLGGFFRYANSMRHQSAEMLLAGMIYGGVFGRHPNLTVLTEELGVGWLPYFLDRCRSLAPAGPWPFDTSPDEMARRNIRSTPLLGLGDPNPFDGSLISLAEMLVFSSDFPHGEGNEDPISIFEPAILKLGPRTRAAFLGENIAECFARTGDPLSL